MTLSATVRNCSVAMEQGWAFLCESNRNRVAARLSAPIAWSCIKSSSFRHAAVLVPLLVAAGQPCVLFTVRSRTLGRHRAQVSFPGGFTELHDATPAATALREAEEELGLPPSLVDVWGQLPTFPDRLRSSTITPVIGCIASMELKALRLNKAEVEKVFTLPLRQLVDPAHRRYTSFREQRLPVFLGGPRRVWGITATILDLALSHLQPHDQYTPISHIM